MKIKRCLAPFLLVLLCFCSPLSAQEQAKPSSELISLDLRGIDITELFRVLSLKTGLTIVPQAGVKGRVSLFLNNVRFEDVLDIILVTNNLASERQGNIIKIMTAEQYYALYGKRFEEKRQVKSFKLAYAKPADVFNTLSQLKSDIGKIIVDESSATVVLVDIPEKIELMEKMVEQLDQSSDLEVMSLKYSKAKDIEPQVSKLLTVGAGGVSIDERSNKIVVTDLPGKIKKIKRMVRAFDEEPLQVLIEAQIVELSLNEKFQRGIDWETILRNANDLDFKGKFALGLETGEEIAGGGVRQEVSVGTLDSDNYNFILQMLQSYGKTHILSQPRIAAVNNQEAKIMVGAREVYVTQTVTSGDTTTTSENVQFVDVGVKLNVTPSISRDGFVMMKIKPEVTSLREYFYTSQGTKVPVVTTSEAESVVKVKDGAMIMIAGLSKKKDAVEEKKMPVLSKIPLVGWLFGSKTTGSDDPKTSELIVFITPRIISGDVPAPAKNSTQEIVLKKDSKGFKEQ